MFEEFGPDNPPQPPAGALEQAMQRGRKLRRQRHIGVASGLLLSIALIGGITLANPFQTNQGLVTPVTPQPSGPAADYSPIPKTPGVIADVKAGLDFGILTGITTAADGTLTLHVNRTTYYEGEAAVAQGASASQDWIVKDTDGDDKVLSFTLDPQASIQAEGPLSNNHEGGTTERIDITPAELIANLKYVLDAEVDPDAGPPSVYVWMRHTGGTDGPVTAIVDQFIP